MRSSGSRYPRLIAAVDPHGAAASDPHYAKSPAPPARGPAFDRGPARAFRGGSGPAVRSPPSPLRRRDLLSFSEIRWNPRIPADPPLSPSYARMDRALKIHDFSGRLGPDRGASGWPIGGTEPVSSPAPPTIEPGLGDVAPTSGGRPAVPVQRLVHRQPWDAGGRSQKRWRGRDSSAPARALEARRTAAGNPLAALDPEAGYGR
jgi:hypothetical protein